MHPRPGFLCPASRCCFFIAQTEHLDSELRELLPKLDAKENDSEEGLRKRM